MSVFRVVPGSSRAAPSRFRDSRATNERVRRTHPRRKELELEGVEVDVTQSRARRLVISALLVATSALVVGLWSVFGPRWVIETLAQPRQVAAVRRDGLEFADGSRVGWKIAADTPAVLELVRAATLRGVERTPEGRAIGLLDIHHWCGTGRRVRHRARVDLERLIEFFEGGPSPRTNEPRVWR